MDVTSRPRPIAQRASTLVRSSCALLSAVVLLIVVLHSNVPARAAAQQESSAALNPIQQEIERQRRRLASSETEERRDAVMRLGWMKRPDSSRVAASALGDTASIVRATAARSVLSLPPGEAATALLPLLQDREEFVRREAAYALGETRSRTAVSGLVALLAGDKEPGVRGAAAVALGLIGDESAVVPLTQALGRRLPASGLLNRIRRRKTEENEFVRRAAARSLGQIRNRAAVPALIAALADERAGDDVRREAARSLGLIGDPAAISALRGALTSRDPYLSHIAYEALLKIAPSEASRPI
jgi:HEAT repeat protein